MQHRLVLVTLSGLVLAVAVSSGRPISAATPKGTIPPEKLHLAPTFWLYDADGVKSAKFGPKDEVTAKGYYRVAEPMHRPFVTLLRIIERRANGTEVIYNESVGPAPQADAEHPGLFKIEAKVRIPKKPGHYLLRILDATPDAVKIRSELPIEVTE
jgi:hypothetical protein